MTIVAKKALRAVAGLVNALTAATVSSPWFQSILWGVLVGTAKRKQRAYDSHQDFLLFVLAHSSLSRAQLFQDLWILWETGGKRAGFFVEFGATNGIDLSNTYLLESRFGWNGILAEPFPFWHAELQKNRSVIIDKRCVWNVTGERLNFVATEGSPDHAGLAARAFDDLHAQRRRDTGRNIVVETVSLNDLLAQHDAPTHIDYLSIDTEGTELEILEGFDFSKYRVDRISVEHNFEPRKRAAIESILHKQGFRNRFRRFSRMDDWYVNEDAVAPSRSFE